MRYGIPRTHWLITMPRIRISNFNDAVAGLSDIKREERIKEPVNGSSENEQDIQEKAKPVNRQIYAKIWIAVVAVVVVLYTFYLLFNLYRTTVRRRDFKDEISHRFSTSDQTDDFVISLRVLLTPPFFLIDFLFC